MRPRIRNVVTAFFLTLLFSNCQEPFTVKTNIRYDLLVVDGYIDDQPGPYFLTLGSSTSPQYKPVPLVNAFVTITDDLGKTEVFHEIQKGKYQLNGNTVKGRPGGTYTLQIKLPDGRTYQSTPEKMPVVSKPADSPFYRVVTDTRITNGIEINSFMVNIYLNTSLAENNKTGLYRWAVSEVWNIFPTCLPGAISCPPICYIYEPYSRFNLKVVKAADYSEFAIRELLLLSRGIDFSFNGRHYFNVTQYSMNQQAYEYWNKVEQLITKRGSIFDAPPAIIPGNISNVSNPDELVLGYFEASATQLTRTFVDRGAIHTYVETCFYYDPYFSFTNISQFCFDCTRHVGSTIVQPGWYW